MSFTITDAFVQQFSGNVRFLAQQQDSRFRGKVLEDTVRGESAYMEQLAPATAKKKTSRHADTPLMSTQSLRRRIAPYPYEWADLVDRADKVRLLIDPASSYAQAGAMAMRRAYDDEVIAAAFATAYTGHSGSTQVTWPNGNSESAPTAPGGTVVAVDSWKYGNGSSAAGLTISKLIEAKMALEAAEGDEEDEYYIACAAKQRGNLLATTEVTNADYAAVKALVDGKVNSFMGFTFVRSERLQLDASSYRRVIAWRKSGLGQGIAQDIEGKISERPDKSYSVQTFADTQLGAARLEEAKVAEIKCQES